LVCFPLYIKNHPFPHPFAAFTVKRDAAILQVTVRGGGGGDVVESSGNSKTASMTDLSFFLLESVEKQHQLAFNHWGGGRLHHRKSTTG
jgi:hypothetical protein